MGEAHRVPTQTTLDGKGSPLFVLGLLGILCIEEDLGVQNQRLDFRAFGRSTLLTMASMSLDPKPGTAPKPKALPPKPKTLNPKHFWGESGEPRGWMKKSEEDHHLRSRPSGGCRVGPDSQGRAV